AHVAALDASKAMVEIITQRFGDAVIARQHDLAEPISWLGDASMDIVVSSLTLHYLRDWSVPLSEFRRVLKSDGRLVMSTHHPAMVQQLLVSGQSYFDTVLVEDRWRVGGVEHEVRYYHRPLQDILNSIIAAGFTIRRIIEPHLTQPLRGVPAEWFQKLSTLPWFLIVEACVTKAADHPL
ncbi:MAG TPA: class I SAM-dependent methyltransferase, partial [Candidatus Baltobacteraceae bacterium]|nr:class I SAM-dependent methyltransferase [Candidatus Baltobacteraceae bacterium]